MNIAVLGTGAIGGYYGGLLARAGQDVHFLLHSDYNHVQQHGLQINSIDGDFHLAAPNVYQRVADMPRCDLIIVALKATQNHLLKQMLPNLVHEHSQVLFLQNGLEVEAAALDYVQGQNIFSGLCFICSNKTGPGTITHLDFGAIKLGQYQAPSNLQISPALRDLAGVLENASMTIELEADLRLARWHKLVWNVPFNGLSVVLNCETQAMINQPHTQQLVRNIMQEIVTLAARYGHSIGTDFVDKMINDTLNMRSYKPSMKIDYEQKRALEFDQIYQQVLDAAAQVELAIPHVAMLAAQLQFCMARNQQSS